MEVTIENLESAVAQFYNSDSGAQAQAHQWLTTVQSSPSAWAFVWDLLQPSRAKEVQFFAATTLHMKIMKSWNEVPLGEYENLKKKLLQTIVQYSTGPELILNRLCMALSALLIQMTPKYWNESIGDLMSMFQPENLPTLPPNRVIWILLEVLTFIPEEFQTMTLSSSHKLYVRNELEKHGEKVMALIGESLRREDVRDAGVKAAGAWLQFGVPLPTALNIAAALIPLIRSKVSDITETCEHELDALNQMLSQQETHKYPTYILEMIPAILQLTADIKASGNDEALTNAYKVLVGIGETHASMLLSALLTPERTSITQGLISNLLDCTAAPGDYPKDECRSHLVFSFWYLLQDEMMALNKDDMEIAASYLVPVYEKLCEILLHKSKLPDDIDSLSGQDQELIRIYRQDIADTIVYCYYVSREHLINLLVRKQQSASSWQEAEAVLHVALAIAECTTAQDDDTIISLLVNTPQAYLNHRVINALNQTIGAYAEWLGNVLGQLIPGLITSLQTPETATSATMALKDITREKTTLLEPYAPTLLAACQEALSKGDLKENECVRLMYSVGRLLSILPYNDMMQSLQPLVTAYTNDLQQYLNNPQQMRGTLLVRLRMLSTLCASLYCTEVSSDPPAYYVLSTILPILGPICQTSSKDHHVIEEVCHFLNSGVVNALSGKSAQTLFEPIIGLGAACYAAQPNKQALDLVRQVCILFGKGETEEKVKRLLQMVTEKTLSSLDTIAPDVLQAYFNLLASATKKTPHLLASSLDVLQLFNFATQSLLAPEQPTLKAASMFLNALVTLSPEVSPFSMAVRMAGHQLVSTCILCISGRAPRSALDTFSDILLVINKFVPDLFPDWLQAAISQLQSPEQPSKDKYYKLIIREKANKRKLAEIVKEFSLICRGLVSVAYEN